MGKATRTLQLISIIAAPPYGAVATEYALSGAADKQAIAWPV